MIKRSKSENLIPVIWYFYSTKGCACFLASSNQRGRDHSELYKCCHTHRAVELENEEGTRFKR
uniref:Putative ovule protein n=1 Tax=Solanum chacoense TaxID=4108 RepID=A0A0V0HFN1_SOLCH